MCRFGNADGKKSLQILQWRNSSSDLVIIEKNPLIIYVEYSYHKIHLCNSSGYHGSDRRWSSIVLLIFNSTWKHCKNPCSCLETLAQKVKQFSCKFWRDEEKTLDKDAGRLPWLDPSQYPTALRYIKLLFCLHCIHTVSQTYRVKKVTCGYMIIQLSGFGFEELLRDTKSTQVIIM